MYQYALTMNQDSDWIFRYEYRRTPEPLRPHSHLHINAAFLDNPSIQFDRLHFPAGRLSIEQMLAHLILEWEIEAKVEDPIAELAETHKRFSKRRTDLIDPPFP